MQNTVDTRYWSKTDKGKVRCELCPRYCVLGEGQSGFCFVRKNENNKIVFKSYGLSTGFCVDPIEKKPLNHFYPGSPVLSFGTAGCNLACRFCQNWDISKSREIERLSVAASPEAIAEKAASLGRKSVAFTYNDPVIFLEYVVDTAIACHERDIKTVAVTAGYICDQPRRDFFEHIDAANVDLKAFNEQFYWKLTGSHLQAVLDTLLYLKHETNVWLEITTLLIPGENDSETEINELCEWVVSNIGANVPLHFSAFHPDWKMLDKKRTPAATLTKARDIARQHGMQYVYTGNVHDKKGQSTYCPACGQVLIGRDWYQLSDWNLIDGKCSQCGELCAGRFEAEPGHWGAKRAPVIML